MTIVCTAATMSQSVRAASSAATGINTALLSKHTENGAGFAGANVVDDQAAVFAQNVRTLLGDRVDLRYMMNMGPMSTYTGHSHSTTGIPYAINGTARVINQKVAIWMASFEDPIKSVLGTAVVREQKIIVTRKYVVGGSALITPERAPARTVSIREDAREEVLCRYGGDLEMNLNLFLRPDEAQEELTMKLEAQRAQLQQVLVSLGYEKIMAQGCGIVQAIQRSSALSGQKSPADRAIEADRIFASAVFGALNKHSFAVANLMATLSRCNIYTPQSGSGSNSPTMLVPPGFDLTKYCSKSEMKYSVSGLSLNEHGTISLPLSNVFTEPNTGLRVLVHFPNVSNDDGAAHPQVVTNELARNVGIATYYTVNSAADVSNIEIVNFKERSWSTLKVSDAARARDVPRSVDDIATAGGIAPEDNTQEYVLLRPNMVVHMMSAIFCSDPGTQTGDLVYAYPSTAVSTSQTTESMRMQLRVYCGCVIKQPENLIILNDVMCSGCVAGHGNVLYDPQSDGDFDSTKHDFILARKLKSTPWTELFKDRVFTQCVTAISAFRHEIDEYTRIGNGDDGHVCNDADKKPILPYRGASRMRDGAAGAAGTYRYTTNAGHLGALDDPDMVDVLEGYQVYKDVPYDTSVTRTSA